MRIQELIGLNVREARQDAGLSQRELGERVAWFPQAVSAAEKGNRDWAAEDLVRVAWILQRPVSWFFKLPHGVDGAAPLDLDLAVIDVGALGTVGVGVSIPLQWVAGGDEADRSAETIAAEIERLTKELQRVLVEPPTVTAKATIPAPVVTMTDGTAGTEEP